MKTIEGKVVKLDCMTDLKNLILKIGHILKIDGKYEVVSRVEYDTEKLVGLRTIGSRSGKRMETIYRVNSTGELTNLFSRVYENGDKS